MSRRLSSLSTLAAAASLLLCLATAGLWVRNAQYYDLWVLQRTPRYISVGLAVGQFHLNVGEQELQEYWWSWHGFSVHRGFMPHWNSHHGSQSWMTFYSGPPIYGWSVTIPFWGIIVLTIALPGWWFWKLLRQRRPTAGCCPACGYDLRATPDRCPECGMAPQKAAAA